MLVAFRLGYLQATCNQIKSMVAAMQAQQTAPPSGPPSLLSKLRALVKDIELLHKLFVVWRFFAIPSAGYTLARWLGLL
jgi:hypothetical protein